MNTIYLEEIRKEDKLISWEKDFLSQNYGIYKGNSIDKRH